MSESNDNKGSEGHKSKDVKNMSDSSLTDVQPGQSKNVRKNVFQ